MPKFLPRSTNAGAAGAPGLDAAARNARAVPSGPLFRLDVTRRSPPRKPLFRSGDASGPRTATWRQPCPPAPAVVGAPR